jgi:hypothetical protein
MTKNLSYCNSLRRRHFDWSEFDRMPRAQKEFMWNAPTRIWIGRGQLTKEHIEIYERALAKSTLALYGPDHPQAKYKEVNPNATAEELGF